ncbi:Acetyltransferase (GNAT) family [Rubellimicrobium mesophilum DSM 19309]|uniref:Acetyltransferase (GNAT) family n=1 Tax=Rubellimicrobium mesophilum DSM 19309 TaxID=442562 RepID=A0A017HUX3_9RHOB|nr:GNAT family N-acetyltransferase [Rubellimicrobium mesophilum]EYD77958.1 Acetyltransferase (GNAT) family [Rubellimicrobium mesophilum DSM 19309]
MTALHEVVIPGAPAALAERLSALVPSLGTERTRLRAIRLSDVDAWAEILCTDRSRWMDGPMSRDDAFVELAASAGGWLLRGIGFWTVEARDGGEVLGFAGVNMEPSDREPELGYFFREAAEGRGYALESCTAARDWAWSQGLPSLVSYVDPENRRSAALAERLGARRDQEAEAAYRGTPDEGVAVYRHPRPETLG